MALIKWVRQPYFAPCQWPLYLGCFLVQYFLCCRSVIIWCLSNISSTTLTTLNVNFYTCHFCLDIWYDSGSCFIKGTGPGGIWFPGLNSLACAGASERMLLCWFHATAARQASERHTHSHTPEDQRLSSKNFPRLPSSSSLSPFLSVPPSLSLSHTHTVCSLSWKIGSKRSTAVNKACCSAGPLWVYLSSCKRKSREKKKRKNSFDQWLKPITNRDSLTTVLSLSLFLALLCTPHTSPRCCLSLWNWICHCFNSSCGIFRVCVCECRS